MYEPQHRSKAYLVFVAAVASLIGWAVFVQYRPYIIKASCSEIAAGSSNILGKRYNLDEIDYSYDSIKTQCLSDAKGK